MRGKPPEEGQFPGWDAYRLRRALCFQVVEHHGLAAASGGRPRRSDEDPDEGIGGRGAKALSQAEKVGRFAATDLGPLLVRQ